MATGHDTNVMHDDEDQDDQSSSEQDHDIESGFENMTSQNTAKPPHQRLLPVQMQLLMQASSL